MIVFITGETGTGKTDTSWSLIETQNSVFLDCDWFASRSPFSWACAEDVASVYRAIFSQVEFHLGEGRSSFVITLTPEMAAIFPSIVSGFKKFGLPMCAFRLTPQPFAVQRRIADRGRDQKEIERTNAARQRVELDAMFATDDVFAAIDNTGLDARATARIVAGRTLKFPQ